MKTAMLFTGQGSQFPGMGLALAEAYPVARETFEEADEVLGEKISQLCFEGPEDQLALTENTQPATLVVSMAAYLALGVTPAVAAGSCSTRSTRCPASRRSRCSPSSGWSRA